MAGGQDPVSSHYRHFEHGEEPGVGDVRYPMSDYGKLFILLIFFLFISETFSSLPVQMRGIYEIISHSLPGYQKPTRFEERAENRVALPDGKDTKRISFLLISCKSHNTITLCACAPLATKKGRLHSRPQCSRF